MEPLAWCRQRLLVRGHPLAASLPFAEPGQRDPILALRTVITEISSIPGAVSETEVALARLNWWRGALEERLPHPAVQALVDTGAAARLSIPRFEALIDGVSLTLDDPRFENRQLAWKYFMAVGGPAAGLEAELLGADEALGRKLAPLGAFACLVRQVRDLALDARANRWLVPLDIQAEFQVSRQDALQRQASSGFCGMVRTWLADGLAHCREGVREIDEAQAWHHRHLLIQHELDRRLAVQLARRPQRLLERRVLPGAMINAWTAWRAARRLRPVGGAG
jgi:15-cis-phytoene synthase